ncbi:MAG: DNA translocase FtsK 4TM domain-containing protein, partial [Pseudomonadota bacterium]
MANISAMNNSHSWSGRRIRELIGFAMLAFGVFIAIALIGFHNSDPSPNLASSRPVLNYAGKFGAYIANPMIQTLGFSSILIVVMVLAWGWRLIVNKKIPSIAGIRISLFILSLVLLSSILAAIPESASWDSGFGGAIGLKVSHIMKHYFAGNSYLLFAFLLLIGTIPFSLGLSMREWKALLKAFFTSIKTSLKTLSLIIPK